MKERDSQEKAFFKMINRTSAQAREGNGATMEHPADSDSWNTEDLQFPGTFDAALRRCRAGLATPGEFGNDAGLAQQPR